MTIVQYPNLVKMAEIAGMGTAFPGRRTTNED
jgi:hypothetical protein